MRKSNKVFQLTIVLMAIIFLQSACTETKEEILNTLEGEWEVTSIMLGSDADTAWFDLFPYQFESFIMEFEEYEDDEGDFEWQITHTQSYDYGSTYTTTGEYECNRAGDEIEIIFDGESSGETFEIFLNGDNLILWWENEDVEYGISTTTSNIYTAERK